MNRRTSRLVLLVAVGLAAYASPHPGGENPQYVEQRTAAQCAEEIEVLQEARWESVVRAAVARRWGVLEASTYAITASCEDAIEADTARCLREARRVTAGRQPQEEPVTGLYPPPGDEAPKDFDPYALLDDVDRYPIECDWAVLDALTGSARVDAH